MIRLSWTAPQEIFKNKQERESIWRDISIPKQESHEENETDCQREYKSEIPVDKNRRRIDKSPKS